jgi:hypothetical protein
MDHNVTALERAFQIAKSGDCKSVAELKKLLRKKRYSLDKITAVERCPGNSKHSSRRRPAPTSDRHVGWVPTDLASKPPARTHRMPGVGAVKRAIVV